MNTETLRQIFKSPFDYTTYSREIVHRLFGCNYVASRPEWLDTNAEGDQSFFIGQMDDADHRLLGFFYTRVADGSDVRRKRVGLRKLISPYLKYDVDGAIAVFDDGRHWRLSYICDLKEGSASAKRFSYILGDENGQYKTPLERLEKVAKLNGRLTLSDLRESFSVDALSDEFFDEYHIHYDRIVAELARQGKTGAIHHDYVKKMMGRIVFLHFLQKKGWLNGNPTFLCDLFLTSPYQADFLEQVLEPLFFGIFNTEPEQREKLFADEQWDEGLLKQWERLPYLNGGLFERDEVDKMNIRLPSSLFNDLFTFLASYNFTVDENDPDDAEIGVDPEMLGKIFESLLEDNKAKGAFYTPKEIVRYMCKESLIAYLGAICFPADGKTGNTCVTADGKNTDCGDAVGSLVRTFVETHEFPDELEPYRDILDRALREVKICDPAIGSGAFPMGLLNELWRCREALTDRDSCSLITVHRSQLKKEIIENNIYGVDIERGAINIARLRFWLSIVVDSEEPQALPNFDYKFMQGNSLIESFEGVDLSRMMSSEGQYSSLGKGRQKVGANQLGIEFVSTDTKRNLQLMLREYFSLTDHVKKAEVRRSINDSVKRYIRQQGLHPSAELRLSSLDPSANQEFFLWHTWFKDIFDKGGFDIVVGNPPYIGEKGHKEIFQPVKEDALLKGFYLGKMDYFYFFFHVAINILCQNGISCFITTNYYPTAMGARKLRKDLAERTNLLQLINLNEFKIFESALGQHNLITLFEKNTSHKIECKVLNTTCKGFVRKGYVYYILEGIDETVKITHVDQRSLYEGEECYIRLYSDENKDNTLTTIFDKMITGNQRLGDITNVNTGLFTACDRVFIDDIDIMRRKFNTNQLEQNLLKPLFKNSDIYKYATSERVRKLLIYHHEKATYKLSEIPNVYAYLSEHRTVLEQRRDNSLKGALRRGRWDVIALPKIAINFDGPKIVAPQRSKSNTFGYNEISWYATSDVFFITNPEDGYTLKYILGLLNSKLYYVWLYNRGKRKGENLELCQKPLSEIPIKKATPSQQQQIVDLVNKILATKKTDPNANTSALEREIDGIVYGLYGLTEEEIAVIERV